VRLVAAGSRAGIAVLVLAGALIPPQRAAADRTAESAPREAVAEIDDPSSGARWLLVRDAGHPGGPGRLIRAEPSMAGERSNGSQPPSITVLPVIRTGDRVRLEEHTPVVDAVLDSVALGPAVAGAPLKVRLKVGGRVVRATAVAPGRALLAAGTEGRP
jgi:hypothetical protein